MTFDPSPRQPPAPRQIVPMDDGPDVLRGMIVAACCMIIIGCVGVVAVLLCR
jgi:hypothetical protein